MVYEIVWTSKALENYERNIHYLEENWTKKEVIHFIQLVEKKLLLLSNHPYIGSPKNKKQVNIRHTFIHKRITLIYNIRPQKKQIELLVFWNTYQNPAKQFL